MGTLEGTQVEIGTTSTDFEPYNPIAGWGVSELKQSKLGKQEFQDVINGYKAIPNAALELIDINGNLTPLLIKIQEGKYINAINEDGTLSFIEGAAYTTFLLPVD
ncbi:MAG: hypothetical protein IIX02_02620, partial [Clostridia bacterium]|nr:hypothetical protein [Clostridia bacterium]